MWGNGKGGGRNLREAELGLRRSGSHTIVALESPLQPTSQASTVNSRHQRHALLSCRRSEESGSAH
jgi:hypothetical protein